VGKNFLAFNSHRSVQLSGEPPMPKHVHSQLVSHKEQPLLPHPHTHMASPPSIQVAQCGEGASTHMGMSQCMLCLDREMHTQHTKTHQDPSPPTPFNAGGMLWSGGQYTDARMTVQGMLRQHTASTRARADTRTQ
jgi:hypothetical protein